MKKTTVLFFVLLCLLGMVACNSNRILHDYEPVKYSADLSKYPTDENCMGYGKILEIAEGKLLVSPGSDKDKAEFGEVVWLICDEAESYSVGQVVTYTFRDVKAPDKEGAPLNMIALLVYME